MKSELTRAIPKLTCGQKTATAFLISNNLVLTAKHAITDHFIENEPIELTFFLECKEYQKINAIPIPISKKNLNHQSIIVLKLEKAIEGIDPLKFGFCRFNNDSVQYKTFGYIPVREKCGTPINIYVIHEHFAKDYNELDKSWNLDLKTDDPVKEYSGLSGGPLLLNDCVCGVLLNETQESGETSRLAGVSLYVYKEYLENLSLKPLIEECTTDELDSEYINIGVTNFPDILEIMKKETKKMLDLTDLFDGRYIKGNYWDEIADRLYKFTQEEMGSAKKYKLHIETLLSIAFVFGNIIGSKTRIDIHTMQNTSMGREFWHPKENPDGDYKELRIDDEIWLSENTGDIALVLGISRDILTNVVEYIQKEQINISKVINCTIDGYIGNDSIIDGKHAKKIAYSIAAKVDRRSEEEKKKDLHIFAASPVSLMFYLGQISKSFRNVVLYEYDFEGTKGITYSKSFELPINLNGDSIMK